MRSKIFRRILFCGLVVLVIMVLITSSFPSVVAKAKPGPSPPGKKYQYQRDLRNARDHQKEALEKIKHDLRLLEEGIVLDDIQKKLEARQSIMEAASLFDDAIEDYENAKNSALNELTKDKKLANLLKRIDNSIYMLKRFKGSCLKVIPLIDNIIRLEEEMQNLPDELKNQIRQAELKMFKEIKKTIIRK